MMMMMHGILAAEFAYRLMKLMWKIGFHNAPDKSAVLKSEDFFD